MEPRLNPAVQAACDVINLRIASVRKRLGITVGVSLLLALIAALALDITPAAVLPFAIVPTLIYGAYAHRGIRRFYKNDVVSKVVTALGADLTYCADSRLGYQEFQSYDLFNERLDVFRSEDEVCGRRRDIAFAVHEAHAAKRVKQGKETREVTWFKGMVVKLEFNKNFAGHTVVIADRDSKILGGLFGEDDDRRGKQIVHMADPDFEETYSVYSTNDQEAHYILTPKLMELMLRARTNLGGDIRYAFANNSLFVTVPSHADRFEAGLWSHVTPDNAARELLGVVALADQLIEVLDLETRIWTRA